MRPGDRVAVFDGSGREAAAEILVTERDRVTVAVQTPDTVDRESPLDITLAVSVSRGDRMDTVVQKATELGVSKIWPLLSERTGVKLDAKRWDKKLRHWRQVAISACEQCGRNRLPEVAAVAPLQDILRRTDALPAESLRLLLHPMEKPGALPEHCASLLLLAGPEGGFSESEVEEARSSGFAGLVLGPRVLRTETTPLAALSVLQARWGDLLPPG